MQPPEHDVQEAASLRRRRPSGDDHGPESEPEETVKRRKRRILSCETCRRLKCRCEYEGGLGACTRCRTLRLRCSSDTAHDRSPVQSATSDNPDAEQRLRRLENSVASIETAIRESGAGPQLPKTKGRLSDTASKSTKPLNHENSFEPADQGVHASPAEVVRRVGYQLSGSIRRTFGPQDDLISLGLLDEPTAYELIRDFIRNRQHQIFAREENDLVLGRDLRQASPFLHAVCCLHGIRNSQYAEFDEKVLHRPIYERVRQMLGQVMLASPLPLAEVTGIMIMALFASSPTQGPEYIDSWILSGHCVQQAMLSINFSQIISRTNSGSATVADQRDIRVWANSCLVNLHWAVTTSRPTIVPPDYLTQCRLLLCFEQANMRDSMLYAEITLYSMLCASLAQKQYLDSSGEYTELTKWRARWEYLFDLPIASTLKTSYYIAWLVLARRSLEAGGEAKGISSQIISPEGDTTHRQMLPDQALQSIVCGCAVQVVQSFLEVPASIEYDMPDFHLLGVSYATLVLSEYEPKPSIISDVEFLRLLQSMQNRCNQSRSITASMRFGVQRALEKVANRQHLRERISRRSTPQNVSSQPSTEAHDEVLDEVDVPADLGIGTFSDPLGGEYEDLNFFFNGGHLYLQDI